MAREASPEAACINCLRFRGVGFLEDCIGCLGFKASGSRSLDCRICRAKRSWALRSRCQESNDLRLALLPPSHHLFFYRNRAMTIGAVQRPPSFQSCSKACVGGGILLLLLWA